MGRKRPYNFNQYKVAFQEKTMDDTMIRQAANWWAERVEQQDIDKEKFVDEFIDLFKKKEPKIISVDYDPDDFLYEVLERCGWEQESIMFSAKGIFRFKTVMKIQDNSITVSDGYGNKYSSILWDTMKHAGA